MAWDLLPKKIDRMRSSGECMGELLAECELAMGAGCGK